ncbi:variant erythrocyte surface antigen-1 family protein [Babesia divergens]|uniref:Variant erythrocyte surface antigen-1 family protein n=1 Tax=Babesia divergens TaxID=32595 RepID=A0AAD9GBY7_BABDI|nr:variant erythrocyte surface antigen-1 family protein [Babesia divergens]
MFFIPSCFPGCLCILVCSSVLRTLRSVLTGSLEPLGRITLMVCYMYYTDVFVGTNNIEKLKDALDAELKDSVNSNDLTQLVHGLCLFMGYPSCVCSLKANVDKSLQDISEKLNEDSRAVKSCVSKPLNLNCSCNSKEILCKCCVIRCIKELRQSKSKCKCPRLNDPSTECKCKEPKGKCCKDFLSGLEACLSLLNLKGDMKDCKCDPKTCCKDGTCTTKGCTVCPNSKTLKTPKDYTVTGLGLLRPSPIRLAQKLEKFFGDSGPKGSCKCQCGTSNKSCCCLACEDTQKCAQACSCSSSGCSCDKVPKKPSECPRKKFCEAIQNVKVLANSSEMTCCESGTKCHCVSDSGSNVCSGSGSLNCCVEKDTSGVGSDHFQHSIKCMIRRVVKFFASFDPSKSGCPKLCCEIFCVLKCCEFLKTFYDKGNKKCSKCTSKGPCNGSTLKTPAPSTSCCGGKPSTCSKSNCCLGCLDCSAIKFSRALQKLQYSGPCGLDLYRLLKDLLNFCSNVMAPNQDFIHDTVLAAVKGCLKCKKSGTDSSGWKACECSSSSSNCSACTSLLQDSKLMSILRHGYLSSYDSSKAKWEDLCQKLSSQCCVDPKTKSKNPSCSKCPCPSPGFPLPASSQSCNGECCDNCDVRKAAKIFLGMLPCLYYGLKIVYERSKYGSGFAGWHDISVNSNDKPSSDLGRFLYAWGYDLRPLISKKGSEFFSLLENLYGSDSSGPLQSLSTLVTKKYFSHSLSSGSSVPSTVRQMLLWLYGLRFQKHFSDIVENCKSLCSPFGKSFNADALCYYIHTCSFILPVAIISLIEDSLSITSLHSEFSKFFYPSDPSDLFEKLCEYARKIFVALAFLYYQCERNAGQGGWNDCAFGQGCVEALKISSPSNSASSSTSSSDCSCKHSGAYLCTAINKDKVHDHCQKGSCRGFGSGSNSCSSHNSGGSSSCKPCPHPLMRFLIDDSSDSDSKSKALQNFRTPFHSSTVTPMGFSPDKLSSPGRKGQDLYHDIYGFCKDGFYPLTRLVQFILCVSQRPPENLGELFGFFKQFVSQLNSKDFKDHFVQWIEGEPGRPSGDSLKTALETLKGSSHSGSSHSPASLFSLSSCHAKKESEAACGPYLHPLTEEVSGVFTKELCSMYLSWICHLTKDFKALLERFHEEAEKKFKTCCLTSCQKIVECPCALPFIYSHGFTFHSPSGLNCVDNEGTKHKNNEGKEKHPGGEGAPGCTRKTCSQFVEQLGLVAEGQPFKDLLEEIERFLWSIRFPFFLFILAFWAFVISYFLYVQLYKLDLLHLKSHAHFSRSFKILPSTLFSDASSKLKDLSYFTL